MAAISRAQLLRELIPGLNALFGLEYNRYPEEHKELFEIDSSERSFEQEQKLSGFGAAPVKPEGEVISYDTGQEVWAVTYQHETIAMGFSLTEEAVEDNLYDSLAKRYTQALARAMAYTKQVKAANIFNNGFTTQLAGDGQAVFSTSHVLVTGATISNRPAVAADLNETSLENAVIQISKWTDERGLLIAAKPTKMAIPVDLQYVATRVLNTELRPATADNDVNALKYLSSIPGGWTVNHWFTDPNAWFIMTDVPNGFKMFQRVPLRTATDGDFDTGNMRYKARERYVFGVSDYLQAFGSPGSS